MSVNFKKLIEKYVLPVSMMVVFLVFLLFENVSVLEQYRSQISNFVNPIIPACVCVMLYSAFCKVQLEKMKPRKWHFYLLITQLVLSLVLVGIITYFKDFTYKEALIGALVCVVGPTAASAGVVASKLGGEESTISGFMIVSNAMCAVTIPLLLPLVNGRGESHFFLEFLNILRMVFPIIIVPFVLAQLTKLYFKRLHHFMLTKFKDLAFYVWSASLVLITARACSNAYHANLTLINALALLTAAVAVCIVHFGLGRVVGSFFNEKVNAGQAFGQRNMIFCIYVALTYTDPISSIVATLHMLVQNFYNSYQIIEYKKLDSGEIKNLYE